MFTLEYLRQLQCHLGDVLRRPSMVQAPSSETRSLCKPERKTIRGMHKEWIEKSNLTETHKKSAITQ